MNVSTLIRYVTLTMLWLALAVTAGFYSAKPAHACNPQLGNGKNYKCQDGDACAEHCGQTTSWCITEYCSIATGCSLGTPNIECLFGGCINGLGGNCTCG
jgi:hypothetical protein